MYSKSWTTEQVRVSGPASPPLLVSDKRDDDARAADPTLEEDETAHYVNGEEVVRGRGKLLTPLSFESEEFATHQGDYFSQGGYIWICERY